MESRGVYFLANDRVKEIAIAFLNSFRLHNPEMPLCLIPFNDDCEGIVSLQDEYDFTIFNDYDILSACDYVSSIFHGNVCGAYRKFSAWHGGFEEFLYIDIDTVVLRNIDFSFSFNQKFDVYTSHSDLPGLIQWCWKLSIFEKNVLSRLQIEFSANTGFIASRVGVFSVARFLEAAGEAVSLKNDMRLECMEQPFFNYLFVNSGVKYSSLRMIYYKYGIADGPVEYWAGLQHGKLINNEIIIESGPPIFLVHWAGIMQGVGKRGHYFPYRKLWLHYRHFRSRNDSNHGFFRGFLRFLKPFCIK
ncbi:hypothetical protein [Cellvibrio polysaccharolyticus]|uniref:Uncharacterized protein n=1 Tax=Cellvibrio polysaccharolyticus TaxID=2082724 RepID=A0A928YTG6_9GAMM|nr:hypothetical protein [Cellvibrio polysaccharolyticus]MBE8716325.1 hypothetical protein [Cellvibrio polysaccharolyticus]